MRLAVIGLPPELSRHYFGTDIMYDFFVKNKANSVIFLSLVGLILVMIEHLSNNFKEFKKDKIYIVLGIFTLGILISTILSPYKEIVFWGYPDRWEGLWINLAYIGILIYIINAIKSERDIDILMFFLFTGSIIMGVIALSQVIGKDILATNFMSRFMIPRHYWDIRSQMEFRFPPGTIYGTLYNPNFMGSYSNLIIPVSFYYILKVKDIKLKILAGVSFVSSLFLLFASGSRAGLIGLLFIIIFGIILYGKNIFREYSKNLMILGIATILLATGVNSILDGRVVNQISRTYQDFQRLLSPSEENFRDKIALKDITIHKDGVTIDTIYNTLSVQRQGRDILLFDQDGNLLDYTMQDERMVIEGEIYNTAIVEKFEFDDSPGILVRYSQGPLLLYIQAREDGYSLIDNRLEVIDLDEVDSVKSFGFEGKERLGSNRGYIWSRTLPVIFEKPLFGHGPDTFPAAFPQHDLYGKLYAYNNLYMLTDKPHNMYLGTLVSYGLVGFLSMMGIIVCALSNGIKDKNPLFMVISLSILGYLGAGLFNDSLLGISQIFWLFLGILLWPKDIKN